MNYKTLLVALSLILLIGSISEAQLFRRGAKRRNANQSTQRFQQQQYQQQQYQQQQSQRQQQQQPQQNLTRRQERIQKRQNGREQVEYQYLMDRRTGRVYYMPKKDYQRWLAEYKAAQNKKDERNTQSNSAGSRTAAAPAKPTPRLLTTVPSVSTQTVAKPTLLPPTTAGEKVPNASPILELNPPSITDEPSAGGSDLIPLFDDPKTSRPETTAAKNGNSNPPKEFSVLERKNSEPKKDK